MTPLFRLVTDPRLAAFVTIGLSSYRRALLEAGHGVPAGVDDLLDLTNRVVRRGHFGGRVDSSGQSVAGGGGAGDARLHEGVPYLLGTVDAADVAGVSVKTLRRRIDDGSVATVRLGRRVGITPEALWAWLMKDGA
jgi:hypothetical protein